MEVPSLPHLIMVLVIFALVFGTKRVPEIAGSLGKGIKEFKRNIRDEDLDPLREPSRSEPFPSARFQEHAAAEEAKRAEPKRLIP